MRFLPFSFLFCFFISNAQMEKHQWNERVLLIISKSDDNSIATKQWESLLKNQKEIDDRKLVIYQIFPRYYRTSKDSLFQKNAELYTHFRKEKLCFQVILIGLDGGKKLRQSKFLAPKKLFAIIDGMPMRKAEIRKN